MTGARHPNDELIERLYAAFARLDGDAMAASSGFKDGLIAEHRDAFSFHAWSRQALGPGGLLLGWTPIMRRKAQQQARAGLDEFLSG